MSSLPVAALATNDATTAITAFIAYVLVTTATGFFGYYVLRNRTLNRLESLSAFWRYLWMVGVTGVLHGGFGLAELLTGALWAQAFRDAAGLFFVVFLAFAMREIYHNSSLAPSDDRSISLGTARRLEVGFMVVVGVEWLTVFVLGRGELITAVTALGGLAFALYGMVYGERLESVARGTSLDTLRRHLVPVLLCAGFIGVTDAVVLLDVVPVVAASTKNVFLVLISAFTFTATIRLQQNVEGLSAR